MFVTLKQPNLVYYLFFTKFSVAHPGFGLAWAWLGCDNFAPPSNMCNRMCAIDLTMSMISGLNCSLGVITWDIDPTSDAHPPLKSWDSLFGARSILCLKSTASERNFKLVTKIKGSS